MMDYDYIRRVFCEKHIPLRQSIISPVIREHFKRPKRQVYWIAHFACGPTIDTMRAKDGPQTPDNTFNATSILHLGCIHAYIFDIKHQTVHISAPRTILHTPWANSASSIFPSLSKSPATQQPKNMTRIWQQNSSSQICNL